MHIEIQGVQKSQNNLKKKKEINDSHFLISKLTTAFKIVWYIDEDILIDQWKKLKIPEVNPCVYGHLAFHKSVKTIQWGKNSVFNKWC